MRTLQAFVSLRWPAACLLATSLSMTIAGQAQAQVSAEICGGFAEVQWDYRTASRAQHIEVEGAHFPPIVEALIRGNRGYLGGDIDYTLRASPNHHRALVAATRYAEKFGTLKPPPNMRYPIECYYERAVRFRRDDEIVRMLYAQFLIKQRRPAEAANQLKVAEELAGESGFTHYNIGLLYLEMKRYDEALVQAHKALARGFDRPLLRQGLETAGRWQEPTPATPEGAASAPADSAAPAPAQPASGAGRPG